MPIAGIDAMALFEPRRATDVDAWPSAGAGMSGTACDLLALLETFEIGGNFLTDATRQTMLSPVMMEEAQANGPGWGFGIGGAVLLDPALSGTPQSTGTFSWSGAYGHTWFIDPSTDTIMVALTNTAWEGIFGQFVTDVRDAIYAQ